MWLNKFPIRLFLLSLALGHLSCEDRVFQVTQIDPDNVRCPALDVGECCACPHEDQWLGFSKGDISEGKGDRLFRSEFKDTTGWNEGISHLSPDNLYASGGKVSFLSKVDYEGFAVLDLREFQEKGHDKLYIEIGVEWFKANRKTNDMKNLSSNQCPAFRTSSVQVHWGAYNFNAAILCDEQVMEFSGTTLNIVIDFAKRQHAAFSNDSDVTYMFQSDDTGGGEYFLKLGSHFHSGMHPLDQGYMKLDYLEVRAFD